MEDVGCCFGVEAEAAFVVAFSRDVVIYRDRCWGFVEQGMDAEEVEQGDAEDEGGKYDSCDDDGLVGEE